MKTFAGKNKVETELRFAPSNIGCEREKARKRIRTGKWIAVAAVCVVAGWFAVGLAKEIITDPDVKINHLLTAFLVLRWLCVKGASTLKTLILIVIITAIFN